MLRRWRDLRVGIPGMRTVGRGIRFEGKRIVRDWRCVREPRP